MDDGDGSNESALSPGGDESDSEDTWHLPDDLSWHHEQGYSESVAVALGCAHRRLRGKGDVVAYRRALACVQPVMGGGMSERQRLHVLFIVALAHASTYPQDAALDPIDAAIELAINLDERRALENCSTSEARSIGLCSRRPTLSTTWKTAWIFWMSTHWRARRRPRR